MAVTYTQLNPVLYGAGAIQELANKISELKGTKAFVIYDQGVKKAGLAQKVLAVLDANNVPYQVFEDVNPDPTDTVIDGIASQAREYGADVVVGIGGGSSLDASKSVAGLLTNPGKVSEYFAEAGKGFIQPSAPIILIPTTSGTGSEVTIMAVVTDEANQVKKTIINHATLAILDPEMTITMPPAITAATGMDAMSHAIEALTCGGNPQSPMSDLLALEAVKKINRNILEAVQDGTNLEARSEMALGSNYAGIAFSEVGVHFGHAGAHEIGAKYHIAHGTLCAIMLPEVVEFSADVLPETIAKIADALDVKVTSKETAGKEVADHIRSLMHSIGIKSLKECGLTREQAVACADGAVNHNWFIICTPKPVDVPTMEVLIGKAYDNYQ